jgi:hypothetical protein
VNEDSWEAPFDDQLELPPPPTPPPPPYTPPDKLCDWLMTLPGNNGVEDGGVDEKEEGEV